MGVPLLKKNSLFFLKKIIFFFTSWKSNRQHKDAKWPPSNLTPWILTLTAGIQRPQRYGFARFWIRIEGFKACFTIYSWSNWSLSNLALPFKTLYQNSRIRRIFWVQERTYPHRYWSIWVSKAFESEIIFEFSCIYTSQVFWW